MATTKKKYKKYRIQLWHAYGDIGYAAHSNNKNDIRKWIKMYPNTKAYVEIKENVVYKRYCHIKDFK